MAVTEDARYCHHTGICICVFFKTLKCPLMFERGVISEKIMFQVSGKVERKM